MKLRKLLWDAQNKPPHYPEGSGSTATSTSWITRVAESCWASAITCRRMPVVKSTLDRRILVTRKTWWKCASSTQKNRATAQARVSLRPGLIRVVVRAPTKDLTAGVVVTTSVYGPALRDPSIMNKVERTLEDRGAHPPSGSTGLGRNDPSPPPLVRSACRA